jgi:arylformamidase
MPDDPPNLTDDGPLAGPTMRLIDISTPVSDGMSGFPGDPPVEVARVRSIAAGDAYNLSRLALGSHAGTHVDPPAHFLHGGLTVDRIDLTALNGACHVLQIPDDRRVVRAKDLDALPAGVERLLLRTANSARWEQSPRFFPDYVALDASAAEWIARRRLRVVGIDALSIESDPTDAFPVHHRLLAEGVLILEGLRLAGVAAGPYELRCLPLRVQDGDGGPARAVLLSP